MIPSIESFVKNSSKYKIAVNVIDPEEMSTRNRISLTLPVINNADRVMFLVSGKEKCGILREILEDKSPVNSYPAAMVKSRKEIVWNVYIEE